jgi:predicted AAA+ superfamily ATPase
MVLRSLVLEQRPKQSFFLWGPRQVGKSALLRATYPSAVWVDLLKTDVYMRYLRHPALLREELDAKPPSGPVIVDEVQKLPALLDEIHWLIENRGIVFGLCGSSARKLRRGHANLLGGRAIRYELHGFVASELGRDFQLLRALNHGGLPRHYLAESPSRLLAAYVDDYLKEEVANEGLVRNLPAFADFLNAAALADTELVNSANIARECAVSAPAVREYFQILVDTLLGRYLPAYTKRPKRRMIQARKFYFADVGTVNVLARRGRIELRSELFGKALENWIFHELSAFAAYREPKLRLSYWRTASGSEVDFVLGDAAVGIEVKSTAHADDTHLRGLRALRADQPSIEKLICVCSEARARRTQDGIDILPVTDFLSRLWKGDYAG